MNTYTKDEIIEYIENYVRDCVPDMRANLLREVIICDCTIGELYGLGLDALDVIELINNMEVKYSLIIDDDLLDNYSNVYELIDYIYKNQNTHNYD